MIKLGDKVKDTMTGFDGVVVERTEFLYGCARIGIQSENLHDGKPINVQLFDEPRVEIIEKLKKDNSETGYKVIKLSNEPNTEYI